MESNHDLISLFEHDLFGKPASTFPDHALDRDLSMLLTMRPAGATMKISDLLSPTDVMIDVRAYNKPLLLQEFAAIDGQAVDIVFVLLLPAAVENAQLSALALVARTLRPPENLARLRSAKNSSELYSAIV